MTAYFLAIQYGCRFNHSIGGVLLLGVNDETHFISPFFNNEISKEVVVIVLTYNHQDLVARCLDSILHQKGMDFCRIIVIDDASTDKTKSIILEYAEKYRERIIPQIHTFNHYQLGVSPVFETLISLNAKFVAFCDGDDYWTDEHKLSKQLTLFYSNAQYNLVHTNYIFEIVGESTTSLLERAQKDIDKARVTKTAEEFVSGNNVKHSTAMIRRSAINEEILQECVGVRANDWVIYLSALAKGGEAFFLDEVSTVHRVSVEGSWNGQSRKEKEKIKNEFYWFAAAKLPHSRLRNLFRRKLFSQHLKELISTFKLYQKIKTIKKRLLRS